MSCLVMIVQMSEIYIFIYASLTPARRSRLYSDRSRRPYHYASQVGVQPTSHTTWELMFTPKEYKQSKSSSKTALHLAPALCTSGCPLHTGFFRNMLHSYHLKHLSKNHK